MPPRTAPSPTSPTLWVLFGDQLDRSYPARVMEATGANQSNLVVLMVEAIAESTIIPSHVQRTTLFLAAMRHHASWLRKQDMTVRYVALEDPSNTQSFGTEIARVAGDIKAARVVCIRPGDHRVLHEVTEACKGQTLNFELVEDPHFLTTPAQFAQWAANRRELVMEYFYRDQRKRLGILIHNGKPVGGTWNLDKENRSSFRTAPDPPQLPRFPPDPVVREVQSVIRERLPELPGNPDGFHWPVTREQALLCLHDFIEYRLPHFGQYQDAMWLGERSLYHALLAPAMNLKLLDPREIVEKAVGAYERGHAPLNSVEGFIRQIIGWREFIRGVYWHEGPEYAGRNELAHHGRLPPFYWTGQTEMTCMRDAIGGVLESAYAHHISRLMVTGNFALIAGIEPRAVADWYLGMYADGVDWVTLPNTLGMALHADGGLVGTKPYAASGKYIERMSNACQHCSFDVSKRFGEDACPFNTFYWDFLIRHEARFAHNPRMRMILQHVQAMPEEQVVQITSSAAALRRSMGISPGHGQAGS